MKKTAFQKKKLRIRAKVQGTSQRPRLCVFRSNKFIYAQLIDDENNKTIVGVSQKHLGEKAMKKQDAARELGLLMAKKASAKKIIKVVFDKGPYSYHGRVKTFADAAREGGLQF